MTNDKQKLELFEGLVKESVSYKDVIDFCQSHNLNLELNFGRYGYYFKLIFSQDEKSDKYITIGIGKSLDEPLKKVQKENVIVGFEAWKLVRKLAEEGRNTSENSEKMKMDKEEQYIEENKHRIFFKSFQKAHREGVVITCYLKKMKKH